MQSSIDRLCVHQGVPEDASKANEKTIDLLGKSESVSDLALKPYQEKSVDSKQSEENSVTFDCGYPHIGIKSF